MQLITRQVSYDNKFTVEVHFAEITGAVATKQASVTTLHVSVLIPFPRKLFFSNPNSNPTIPACVAQIEIPFPFFYCFFSFMNPSPSAQNPISQPLKKANPSSHFTPSRPSLKQYKQNTSPRSYKTEIKNLANLGLA